MTDPARQLDKEDARQGKSGLGVRYVLAIGMALIIVIGVIVFLTVK